MAPTESDALVSNTNTMRNNLLEELPGIIGNARQEAGRVLGTHRSFALDTREWVLPAKDSALLNWIKADKRRRRMNAQADVQPNRLIHGDDLLVMAALLAGDALTPSLEGTLDLVYMDLPLASKGGRKIEASLLDGVAMPLMNRACKHRSELESGIVAYLTMLAPRLILAWELLSDRGSVCLRVGAGMKYYVKMIAGDLFGTQNPANRKFAEEAIGCPPDTDQNFENCRDTIVIFRKCQLDQDRQDDVLWFPRAFDFDAAFPMRASLERPTKKLLTAKHGNPLGHDIASYDDWVGCGRSDTLATSLLVERNSEVTQGRAPLFEAIILGLTHPNSIVADFSGRSGNTACIAERLGRRWITSDSGRSACAYMRSRLIDQNVEPFLYQAIDDISQRATDGSPNDACCAGDVLQIVLRSFGALPLPVERNPDRNLGQILTADSKTLVWVESLNELTGAKSLKKAIAQRDRAAGGWSRVTVLAWELDPLIDASIASLNDSRLEVLKIPPDLFDMVEKTDDVECIRGAGCSADIQA